MGDISSSVQIVDESLRNMIETLECAWVAAVFNDDVELLGELSGRVFTASEHEPKTSLVDEAHLVLSAWGGDEDPVVVTPEKNNGLGARDPAHPAARAERGPARDGGQER